MTDIDEIIRLFRDNHILVLLPLLFCLGILQAVIILQLTWYSIGIVLPLKRTIIPGIIAVICTWASRIIIKVPFHMFVTALFIILIIIIFNKVDILSASIGVLFTHTIVVIGSVIFVEPILIITPSDKATFFFQNLFGFAVGIILETIFPLLVLLFLMHKNIVLLKAHKRD